MYTLYVHTFIICDFLDSIEEMIYFSISDRLQSSISIEDTYEDCTAEGEGLVTGQRETAEHRGDNEDDNSDDCDNGDGGDNGDSEIYHSASSDINDTSGHSKM